MIAPASISVSNSSSVTAEKDLRFLQLLTAKRWNRKLMDEWKF